MLRDCAKKIVDNFNCWEFLKRLIKVEFKINDLQGIIGAQNISREILISLQVII